MRTALWWCIESSLIPLQAKVFSQRVLKGESGSVATKEDRHPYRVAMELARTVGAIKSTSSGTRGTLSACTIDRRISPQDGSLQVRVTGSGKGYYVP